MAVPRASDVLSHALAALPRGGALTDEVWAARHRGICLLLWVHVPGLAVVGLTQGAPLVAVVLGSGAVAALTVAAQWSTRGHSFRSTMAVLGLLSSSAILIDYFSGLIEAHFHFFIVIAVVSLYQAWLPYLVAVGYVLSHHLVLGMVIPGEVYNHHAAIERPLLFAVVHAGAVLAESVACLVFWRATERALDAERLAGEELEAANAELTRANLAVSDLVGMLSHDLRVPLSVLIGYSEMARESWPEMSEDEKVDYLRRVSAAGSAMHQLLDDTLTVSALDSHGVEARGVPLRVDDAVREVVQTLAYRHQVDLNGLNPATAVVDRGHLDQVLTNLLTNAHKYGGGDFSVTTDAALGEVSIRITDGGPGIPAGFVPHLFDRFTRSEDARTGSQKGTGLGLYITRNLLQANYGSIRYAPAAGGGSTFCVTLPRHREFHRERDDGQVKVTT